MAKNEIIPIHNSMDIIAARMVVRDTARQFGLRLMDQSCISLATSSIASAMGMGVESDDEGQILIECLQAGSRKGLRVSCSRYMTKEEDMPLLNHSRSMVDEFEVKKDPPRFTVVLTKWAG